MGTGPVKGGLFLLFAVLKLDWTQFGWIAGGLSIGIGFGMQEVVANFVCGLILLFEHPNVSADPPPMAIFNEFADSSLNILLRVFLPDRSSREATIRELHTEIDERFAAAGIEIPFPQRDFHLRSGWDTGSREANESKHSAI